jgi:hypothetical protein
MSKPLNRSIFLFIALVLLLGFASKFILKDQVIALSPPEIIPSTSPIPIPQMTPTPCFEKQEVLQVYPSTNPTGCNNLGVALLRAATQADSPNEIYVRAGTHELNTQDFVDARSPSFAALFRDKDKFVLKGEVGPNGENLATITVNGTKGLFLLENSTVVLDSLNFSGSTTNGLLHAENGSTLMVSNVHSTYTGSNVFEVRDANRVNFYRSSVSNGTGALLISNTDYAVIEQSAFKQNARGIVVQNSEVRATYNLFVDNQSDGYSLDMQNTWENFIANNTFVQNSPSHYQYPIRIIKGFENGPSTLTHNIVFGVQGGILLEDSSPDVANIRNNNIFVQGSAYSGMPNYTGVLGNISSDPLFGNNYCLQPNSPSLLSSGLFMGHTGQCESLEPTHEPHELFIRIDINPGQLTTTIGKERILFSAQAVAVNNVDESIATYEWGMSSDNSIGTLFSDPSNQKQAWFTPVRAGRGDIWVTVRIGDYHKTASVPVVVNKLCQERNSCTSDACIQIVPPGGWCASEALPGDVDFNNSVNYQDVIKFKAAFDKKFYPADFNFDGKVNIYDFLMLVKNFGLSLDVLDDPIEVIPETEGAN